MGTIRAISTQSGIRGCKVFMSMKKWLLIFKIYQGVYIKGDMKLIAGSYSILRRREHKSRTVFLYNVTEDSQENYDLR